MISPHSFYLVPYLTVCKLLNTVKYSILCKIVSVKAFGSGDYLYVTGDSERSEESPVLDDLLIRRSDKGKGG